MNIYDFDDTIYKGDSGVDFVKYSFKKKPFLMICHLFKVIGVLLKYIFKAIEFKELKEYVFSYVKKINNLDDFINEYVKTHTKNIKGWYIKQKKDNDLIVSASLDFYLLPLCKELNIKNVICTKYDIKNGKMIGKNCHDLEKVNRINKEYGKIKVENGYSDSKSDLPILELAKKAYMVKDNKVTLLKKNNKFKENKINFFLNRDFLLFIFCGGMGTLTNFIFSCIFALGINPVVSYVLGYALSLFVAYYLNIKLIFEKGIKLIDFIKFVISYIPNFIILFSFVYIFITMLSWNHILVYLLAAIFGIPITFIFVKLFAFKKNKIKS